MRKTGNTWQTQRNLEKARQAYETAESALGQEPVERDVEWWQEWLAIQLERLSVFYLGDSVSQMDELVQKVRPIADQFGTHEQHARLLHTINMADNLRERFVPSEATIKNARRGLALRQESGHPSGVALGHFSLGFNLLWSGALDEAQEHLLIALEFGEKAHYAWLTTVCLTYLTTVHRKRGQVPETEQYAKRSLTAASENQMSMYIASAKANLAWVAWRNGNLCETKKAARAAHAIWHKTDDVSPFHWIALWPLIGVALAGDHLADAVDHAREMLGPTQQPLPDVLAATLEEAIEYWDRDKADEVRQCLEQAIEMAPEWGYL
jgi:tetratricopeptide (TPR) repeat protein